MSTRRALRNAGIHVYGLGAIALGLVGLVWGDFAAVWQPVPASTPHRTALAYLAAASLLAAGASIQWRRIAQAGVVALAILYLIFALLWLPRVIGYPQIFATWGGFFEQFSLVAAALVVHASLAPGDSAWAVGTARIGRFLYGICALSFALNHFFALKETARMVPAWIPHGTTVLGRGDRDFSPARRHGNTLGSSGCSRVAIAHSDACYLRRSGLGASTLRHPP
jgi:hypothetical protein